MTFPDPVAGLVIRYSYLWRSEHRAGAAEGAKDRPAAIVLKRVRPEGQAPLVFVAPITHTEPQPPTTGVPIPASVARRLGLDDAPKWVIVSEVNYFDWSGYDLRAEPKTGRYDYGMLPKAFFEVVIAALQKQIHNRTLATSGRNDDT